MVKYIDSKVYSETYENNRQWETICIFLKTNCGYNTLYSSVTITYLQKELFFQQKNQFDNQLRNTRTTRYSQTGATEMTSSNRSSGVATSTQGIKQSPGEDNKKKSGDGGIQDTAGARPVGTSTRGGSVLCCFVF